MKKTKEERKQLRHLQQVASNRNISMPDRIAAAMSLAGRRQIIASAGK